MFIKDTTIRSGSYTCVYMVESTLRVTLKRGLLPSTQRTSGLPDSCVCVYVGGGGGSIESGGCRLESVVPLTAALPVTGELAEVLR